MKDDSGEEWNYEVVVPTMTREAAEQARKDIQKKTGYMCFPVREV